MDALNGLSIFGFEGGPQRLVPVDKGLECCLQRITIEAAANPHRAGDIVERCAWLELLDEPKSSLCKGDRNDIPTIPMTNLR
jgi:hypothetical protein